LDKEIALKTSDLESSTEDEEGIGGDLEEIKEDCTSEI
jgi:hypothetical protein